MDISPAHKNARLGNQPKRVFSLGACPTYTYRKKISHAKHKLYCRFLSASVNSEHRICTRLSLLRIDRESKNQSEADGTRTRNHRIDSP